MSSHTSGLPGFYSSREGETRFSGRGISFFQPLYHPSEREVEEEVGGRGGAGAVHAAQPEPDAGAAASGGGEVVSSDGSCTVDSASDLFAIRFRQYADPQGMTSPRSSSCQLIPARGS